MILATQSDAMTPPAAWTRVHVKSPMSLGCGHFHYLAIAKDGVYSWGRGPLGVLGHGGEDDEARPRLIDALASESIESVAAGPYHSAAITNDGRLYMWGWMPFAPTADGGMEETFSRVPRSISLDGATRVVGVACGCFATAAWDSRGQLYTWGRSTSGQLGHGGDTAVASPRPVEALLGVRVAQVAFGGVQTSGENTGFMLVRSEAGVVFSCGSNRRGRLGRAASSDALALTEDGLDDDVHYGVPGEVMLGRENALAATIAAADNHAAALTTDGVAYVWGANDAGLLGLEDGAPDSEEPLEVGGLPVLTHCVCTAFSTAFLAESGELLLLGGDPSVTRPRLAGLPGFISSIFGGGHHLGVMLYGLKPSAPKEGPAASTQIAKPHMDPAYEGARSILILMRCVDAWTTMHKHPRTHPPILHANSTHERTHERTHPYYMQTAPTNAPTHTTCATYRHTRTHEHTHLSAPTSIPLTALTPTPRPCMQAPSLPRSSSSSSRTPMAARRSSCATSSACCAISSPLSARRCTA